MRIISFLFICTGLAFGQDPAFKTTLSENGLNYVQQVGVELLEASIATLQIPQIQGSTGINLDIQKCNYPIESPIGTISYTLSNIVLDSLSLPSSSAQMVANTGIVLQM
jgi:hypothetical protein